MSDPILPVRVSVIDSPCTDGPVCPHCKGVGRLPRRTTAFRVLEHGLDGDRVREAPTLEAALYSFNPDKPYSVVSPEGYVIVSVPANAHRKRLAVVAQTPYAKAVRDAAAAWLAGPRPGREKPVHGRLNSRDCNWVADAQ